MGATTVKRLAADILNVGVSRIRIKPEEKKRVDEALTREDVRGLISDGIVYKIPKKGNRRSHVKKRQNTGRRKGAKQSKKRKKEAWMEKVRAQRKYLTELIKKGELSPDHKKSVYKKIKGGAFKGKRAMYNYLVETGLINKKE